MSTPVAMMTVDEFRQWSEPSGSCGYELRHGEVVAVTRPKLKHIFIQKRLEQLLEEAAGAQGFVTVEFPYRPVPEYNLWVANVAFVAAERIRAADPEDNLTGAPDLVVEILSSSHTAAEMYEKEQLCLENGCHQFWVVDPHRRQIRVTTAAGNTTFSRAGQLLPLSLFGPAQLLVDRVFD